MEQIEKDINEKRYNQNLKRYKILSKKQLTDQEEERIKFIYEGLTFEEAIDAELIIIKEKIETEKKISEKFKREAEEIIEKQTGTYDEKIKKILTALQLALNIKPVYFKQIEELQEDELYKTLEQYLNQKRKYIRRYNG